MRAKSWSEKRRRWMKRRARVQCRLSRSDRPRLTVFRSARHTYAMLVDPETGRTIAGVSTRSKRVADQAPFEGKVEAAKKVGLAIAELASSKQIDKVVFNRHGFLYHGRVKAVADGAREGGLRL